jgi:hypothetical protein
MIRFIARGLVYVTILLVLAGAASEIGRAFPHSDTVERHRDRISDLRRQGDSIEILLLGNSHITYGIATRMLPGTAHVLGLHWNDVFEVQHQVRVLLPRLPRLHTAIISLSYFSFHWDNAAGDDDYYLNSRRLFYAEERMGRWIPGDFRNYVTAQSYWLARPDHWYNVLDGIRHEEEEEKDDEEAVPAGLAREDLDRDAEMRLERIIRSTAVMEERRRDLQRETYEAVVGTIRLLQDQGVQVVFVTPPLYQPYLAGLEATRFPAEMRALASRLVDEHGVVWIDAGESEFQAPANLFMDADHLNLRGRVRFTRWLLDQVVHAHAGGEAKPLSAKLSPYLTSARID